jgi:Asp-tRNA(Asn)/Glu-tRNA(Gln) amidotransferase A subunit family amidase
MDLARMSASEMARAIRDGDVGPVELFEAHAARIAELNPKLNAIVLPRLDEARKEAKEAERALGAAATLGPLHGVPFTAKESLDVAGMATTLGSKLLQDRPPAAADAVVVDRMRKAGAVLLGKTNVSEFLAFYDSVNLVYGATRNPHDGTRSAGGSSGGEAAAIAAAMSPAGLGSDLGSSIRQPAHFTGIFGLCPSRGLVPSAGHQPWPPPLAFHRCAQIGPLARTANDIELLLGAVASQPLAPAMQPRRAAVYEEDGVQLVSAVCRQALRRAADALGDAGWELTEERPPDAAEVRSAYDGVVYQELAMEFAPLVRGREDELSDHGRRTVAGLAGIEPSFEAYIAAGKRLVQLEARADEWVERHELALCPVAPGPAPELGLGFTEIDGEPPRAGGLMTLATYANALGLPSLSVPVLRTNDGLPVGVLVTGRRGRDLEVIAAARELERLLGGYIAP